MLFYRGILLFIIGMSVLSSCLDDDFSDPAELQLHFSTDSVLFDTVFTTRGSITKQFRVINPHRNGIRISRIQTAKGADSQFRINVDGESGPVISDINIAGGDSIYVFVDVEIDPSDESLPFVVSDDLRFIFNHHEQSVKLVAWGQNANFYRNQIVCDEVWNDDKPYVIVDSILVPRNCKLTIEAGTRVHSHHMSAILVGGTMVVNGEIGNEVVFEGDRLDEGYRDRDGQWLGIRFLPRSSDNEIHTAIIKNGIRGIQVDSLPVTSQPNLIVTNSIVRNMSQIGILGFTSHIEAVNTVIDKAHEHLFAGDLGGIYTFLHCTFNNSGYRRRGDNPSVIATNSNFDPGGLNVVNDLELTILNSIIWGNLTEEFGIVQSGDGDITLGISDNLIKTEQEGVSDHNIVNEDPKFEDPGDDDLHLREGSPAIGAGRDDLNINMDIEGRNRKPEPDLGAYESSH